MGMEGEDEEGAEAETGDDDEDIYDTFQGIQVGLLTLAPLQNQSSGGVLNPSPPPSPSLPFPSLPSPPPPSPPILVKAPEDSAVVAMDATDKLVAYLSCGVSGVTVKVYSGSLTAPAKQSPGEGGAEGVWCGRGRWNECLIQATCCASMIMRGVECVSAVEPQKQLSLCSVMLPLGGWWVVQ